MLIRATEASKFPPKFVSGQRFLLLGDSAYTCSRYVVTPYKDNGHLTKTCIKLSSGRVAIEHTFGILKQRFRQLYYCKMRRIEKLCHFLRACCVLHKLANEEDFTYQSNDDDEPEDELEPHQGIVSSSALRDSLCQQLQEQ
ncbi:uncharacterized protein [Musca autumnalis]|uniref:uncharacterized protein n=1 Tax=Musca autumnalis TaxID=221902 RepID=UPI003CED6457